MECKWAANWEFLLGNLLDLWLAEKLGNLKVVLKDNKRAVNLDETWAENLAQ